MDSSPVTRERVLESLSGSGKVQGLTAKGEYHPIGNVPGLVPNGFKNCNHYAGSYKLQ